MKLQIYGTANRRISNPPEAEMMKCGIAALSLFKIDRIHYFDIRHSLFDIRYSLFQSFFYRFDWTLAARGGVRMKLHKIWCFSNKYLTAEIAESAEIFLNFLSQRSLRALR
jgi:hypothetical protein